MEKNWDSWGSSGKTEFDLRRVKGNEILELGVAWEDRKSQRNSVKFRNLWELLGWEGVSLRGFIGSLLGNFGEDGEWVRGRLLEFFSGEVRGGEGVEFREG